MRNVWLAGWIPLLVATLAFAELPTPRLTTIYPLGGQIGTSTESSLGGTELDGLEGLHLTCPGVTATVLEDQRIRLDISSDATPGPVELRAVGRWGVSTSRLFFLDNLPQAAETEPNNLPSEANPITVGSAVSGRIDARADVDYYRFAATAGQKIVIDCQAERLDSRLNAAILLLDANGRRLARSVHAVDRDPRILFVVPSDGEYLVQVSDLTFDGSGEHFYRLTIHTGPCIRSAYPPLVSEQTPTAIELDGIHLPGGTPLEDGGETILQAMREGLEHVSLPPAAEALTPLPGGLVIRPNQWTLPGYSFRLATPDGTAHPIRLYQLAGPWQLEEEPNDLPRNAMRITVPGDVAGRFVSKADRDYFRFSGTKGQALEFELLCEQLGARVDPVLLVQRITSEEPDKPLGLADVQELDDQGLNVGRTKLITSSHDPVGIVTLPEDGDYLVRLWDRMGSPGERSDRPYLLRITPPRPRVTVYVTEPEENNSAPPVVRSGGTAYAQAFVLRQGGFAGPVRITAKDLPEGIECPELVIPAGVNEGPLVMLAASEAPAWSGLVQWNAAFDPGTGSETIVPARTTQVVWPGADNAPKPARGTEGLPLGVRDKAPYRLIANIEPMTFGQGSIVDVSLGLERHWPEFTTALATVTALHLPPNATASTPTLGDNQNEGTMTIVLPANVPPGTYTLTTRGTGQVPFTKTPEVENVERKPLPVADVSNPFHLTIVARPAELVLDPAAPSVVAGTTAEIKLKVTRHNGFAGPLALSLRLPTGITGIRAPEHTLEAEATEWTIPLEVAADCPPGEKAALSIRGQAEVDGQPVTVDAIFTLTVTAPPEPTPDAAPSP